MTGGPTSAAPRSGQVLLALAPALLGVALQVTGLLLVPRCAAGATLWLHGLSCVAVLLTAWAAQRCWRALQRADRAWRADGDGLSRQARFFALGATVLSITAIAVVGMTWLAMATLGCA